MSTSTICNDVFKKVIDDYHILDFIDAKKSNPYDDSSSLEKIIYDKCWIDTIQWHLEDRRTDSRYLLAHAPTPHDASDRPDR